MRSWPSASQGPPLRPHTKEASIAESGQDTVCYSWYNEVYLKGIHLRTSKSPNMLASRTLPPIPFRSPNPPPVATFVNIPRRYTRTRMPLTNDAPPQEMEGVSTSPRQRRSDRISGNSATSSVDVARRSRDGKAPSSALSSPRAARKRTSSDEEDPHAIGSDHESSVLDPKPPHSTSSIASGELSGHICLCQPEPKIPRPRNGEFALFFISGINPLKRRASLGTKQMLCLRTCIH